MRASEKVFRALLWMLILYSVGVWIIGLVEWFKHPLAQSSYNTFGGSPLFRAFALFVAAPLIAILGGMILRKQRQNLIGLLLLAWAGGFASFGISVATPPILYNLVSLPITAWWTTLILSAFYFPDGHAYPRWLSPVLPAIMVLALVTGGVMSLSPTQLPYTGTPANPFFVPGAQAVNEVVTMIYIVFVLPLIVGVFVSPLLRYRHADFVQRQQIKWFAWWSAIIFAPYLVFYFTLILAYPELSDAPPVLQAIGSVLVGLVGICPPIIITFSILRYRLYDIDVIIRKTLLYTATSALLAFVFFGSVILLQRIFEAVTGQQSQLAIVLSTLAIAAIFNPLRNRIQAGIDRRFYRKKYDAQQVLAQFALVTRDETEMDKLTAELGRVVQETVQPEGVTVWLREFRRNGLYE
ncbi:MAG: hypothetical protein KAX65_04065 [Caldilineaceae bacterium]|nr:hypothetical protein [Caldilineaceae bacterium]